jgi:hypothetical protein
MVGFFMKEHFSGTLKMLIYILRVPQKCSFKIHLFIELESTFEGGGGENVDSLCWDFGGTVPHFFIELESTFGGGGKNVDSFRC